MFRITFASESRLSLGFTSGANPLTKQRKTKTNAVCFVTQVKTALSGFQTTVLDIY